jgi:acyl-ACP thioesterase
MSIDVFSLNVHVKFSHTDRSGFLTPAAALDYAEEAASGHAELLGAGFEAMTEKRQIWVLSRISVHMEKRPRFGETVTVRTWPRGHERLFAIRDYEMTVGDHLFVRARSSWIILDMDTRRPLRPDSVMEKMPLNEGKNALPENAAALAEAPGLAPVMERKALYSDLDFNGHVHNTRYMQWVCDLFEPRLIENAETIAFDMNYLKEIPASSVTSLWLGRADGLSHIEGRQGNVPMFRARIAGLA